MTVFMNWYRKEINFFPLWCVPYRKSHQYEWLSQELWNKTRDDLFLDIAIYGMKKKDKDYYKMIEDELMVLGGIKTLISTNKYSKEDFWKVWNKENYDKVKGITDPFSVTYTPRCARHRRENSSKERRLASSG
jgi:hypothetical protein